MFFFSKKHGTSIQFKQHKIYDNNDLGPRLKYTVNVRFSTGFLTIIFSTFLMFPSFIINLLMTYYSNEVTPQMVEMRMIFTTILTTFLPIFWNCSNPDLREFSVRKIQKLYWPLLGRFEQYKDFFCNPPPV